MAIVDLGVSYEDVQAQLLGVSFGAAGTGMPSQAQIEAIIRRKEGWVTGLLERNGVTTLTAADPRYQIAQDLVVLLVMVQVCRSLQMWESHQAASAEADQLREDLLRDPVQLASPKPQNPAPGQVTTFADEAQARRAAEGSPGVLQGMLRVQRL